MEKIMEDQNKVEAANTDGVKNFFTPFVKQFIEEISWDFETEESRVKAVKLIAHFLSLKYPVVISHLSVMNELRRQLKIG
ncbi:hypothetical protein QVL04_004962 [Escherichia coli]|nr:hypothetical protein [Escherichia coli]